jgi:hypothetical protein
MFAGFVTTESLVSSLAAFRPGVKTRFARAANGSPAVASIAVAPPMSTHERASERLIENRIVMSPKAND